MGLSDWLWVVVAFLLFDVLLGAVTIWFINWYGERDLARIRARFESQQDKDKGCQKPIAAFNKLGLCGACARPPKGD